MTPENLRSHSLAWSEADLPAFVPHSAERAAAPRPRLAFVAEPAPPAADPWHRRPLLVLAAVLAVIAVAGGATALALRSEPAAPRTVVAVPAPQGATAEGVSG